MMAAAPAVHPQGATHSYDQVLSWVLHDLTVTSIAPTAGEKDSVTNDFKAADAADEATGNPHAQIFYFLALLSNNSQLGYRPAINPSDLLEGVLDTPEDIALQAMVKPVF